MSKIPSSVCLTIMQTLQQVMTEQSLYFIGKLKQLIAVNDLKEDIFSGVLSELRMFGQTYDNFVTDYTRNAYFSSSSTFLKPTEIVLGSRLENKFVNGHSKLIEVRETCYYFCTKDVFCLFFQSQRIA